ncbi:hypothetical protein [Nocardia araoensis]|uniref:hypothetical protein n=1 Tax=Nocardia araoensis TaxID=228600 RepID=UPI0002FEFF4E|nr:hypothetical protein [Nocardia araoensis]
MSPDTWIIVGFATAIGLPLVVLVVAILWPEQVPQDRSADAIRQRIEEEDGPPSAL